MYAGVGGSLVTRRVHSNDSRHVQEPVCIFRATIRDESRLLLLYTYIYTYIYIYIYFFFLIYARARNPRAIFSQMGAAFLNFVAERLRKQGHSDWSVTLSKHARTFSTRRDSGFMARMLNRRLHTQCWVAKILQVYNARSCFLYQLIYVHTPKRMSNGCLYGC